MINDTSNPENINENAEISQKELILEEKKQQLLEQKELQEDEIFDRISSIKSEAIEKLKIVASIGSVAIGAYLVLKYFFGDKNFSLSQIMPNFEEDLDEKLESKLSHNTDENGILGIFKREIALFLVSIAKQKILELLALLQKEDTEDADFEEDNQE